ncbi:MAG TPA: HAMP domain-containing sensor histidine kinase [Longimicrobium sp.]|nr:HAMP domain-containing sensor histidine kinase [Longimicrobium sp.]
MSLRQRIVLTLLAISAILVVPALVALLSLSQLRGIVGDLRERDTRATSTLGWLSTTLEELETAQSSAAALFNDPEGRAPELLAERDSLIRTMGDTLRALENRPDASEPYGEAVAGASREWSALLQVIRQEQQRLEQGVRDTDAIFRNTEVIPAFDRMTHALQAISDAIDREAEEKVAEAGDVARWALTATGLALALALGLTVIVGTVLTRQLLRPIQVLRRGMAHVAEGDFEPNVQVPAHRPDELGDLSRSFRTMTEQLAELDRLKAEFVSVASHEIKTPLSVIRGYVSLLADGIYGEVSETQKKTLQSISDQVDRLTRLVHRLLDISRFEAGGGRLEVRRINVRDFLDELTQGFHVLAFQNGIDFQVRVADDVPVNLEGDADRLNEVLGNLLSNAFKFTPRAGTISLDARRDGTGVLVAVADTGVGIPPDKLPKIFEKFYQVDNDAQPRSAGSGLGLAIAREIVEAHGGTITAESQVGEGTRFHVSLPERPPAVRAADHPPTDRR